LPQTKALLELLKDLTQLRSAANAQCPGDDFGPVAWTRPGSDSVDQYRTFIHRKVNGDRHFGRAHGFAWNITHRSPGSLHRRQRPAFLTRERK
jgi:hypothetical protein